jgi:hypothetical protein
MRTASIQAAREIFGVGSCEEIAVSNGWYAVGVGNSYPNTITMNGPLGVCYNSSVTYTLANVPNGAAITWSPSNSFRTVAPSIDGLSATVKNVTTSNLGSFVTASVNGCSGQLTTTKNISLGVPVIIGGGYTNTYDNTSNPIGYYPGVTNPACTGYYINSNMNIAGASGLPNVTWTKVSSTNTVNFTQTGNDVRFYLFGDNQNVIFKLTTQNACGTSTKQFAWQSGSCSGGGGGGGCFVYSVSPNPTSKDVNVDVATVVSPCTIMGISTQADLNALLITAVKVYDISQHLKKYERNSGTKHFKVDLGDLIPGIYYVEIIGNNNHKERRIIYKR